MTTVFSSLMLWVPERNTNQEGGGRGRFLGGEGATQSKKKQTKKPKTPSTSQYSKKKEEGEVKRGGEKRREINNN